MLTKTFELLTLCLKARLAGAPDLASEAVLSDWADEEGLLVVAQALRAKQNPPKVIPMSDATVHRRKRIGDRMDLQRQRVLSQLYNLMVPPIEADNGTLSYKEHDKQLTELKKVQAYERHLLRKKWDGRYR